MKKTFIIIAVLVVLVGVIARVWVFRRHRPVSTPSSDAKQKVIAMQLHSSAFEEGGMIPSKYTCDGDNSSPPLSISGLPTGAKTLALVLEDPDAPNGTWVHWTLWNLPTETSSLPEGSIPSSAVEGVTSFGKPGYGGPCPPDGTHHYIFTLYALDTALSITSYTDRAGLGTAMQGHVLAQATLTGLYAKQ